jgi:multisubunit Na+/H+ antiporter MnhE subunit
MWTFFATILAGLAWMALNAEVGWGSFAAGMLVGIVIWRLEGARANTRFGPVRAVRLLGIGLRLLGVFLWELVVANFEQLRIVLAPRIDVSPGWIRFGTSLETPAMRAVFGAMITLTPGSLTYEESSDDGGCTISLHVLDLRDEERLVERIRSRFETPLRAMERL